MVSTSSLRTRKPRYQNVVDAKTLARIEALSGSDSLDALYAATKTIVAEMGFDYFIYGVRVATSLTHPYQFVFSGYPPEWRRHYAEAGYEGEDPTVDYCIRQRRAVPVIWDRAVFATKPAAKLWAEATDAGLRNGASFPVRGACGEAAMLSLADGRDPRQARADVIRALGDGQLLACYLHEAIGRLVLRQETIPLKKTPLSPREHECLLWAADGKTSWEIAKIIGVSERTAIFHLHNATEKLGVSNRQHAVARAVALGLIAP